MGPRDRPRPIPDGATCTACGATVPSDRIRTLAQRDDVAFVELACPRCGSTALGLLMSSTASDGEPVLDVAAEAPPNRPADRMPASGPDTVWGPVSPISEADVEAVRRHLTDWDGDLVGWLDALDRGDRNGSVVDR